jgi:hypothetical protein
MKCCRICNQGRLLAFHHSAALSLLAALFPSLPSFPLPLSRLPFLSFPPLSLTLPHNAAVVPGEHEPFRNSIAGSIQVDDASTFSFPQRFFASPLPGKCPSSLPLRRGHPVKRSTPFEDTFPLFFKYLRVLPLESPFCHRSLSFSPSEASLRFQRECDPLSDSLRGLPGPGFSACFHHHTTWFHGLMAPRRDG